MKIIEVSWVDSASDGSWVSKDNLDYTPATCRTVGYQLKRDEKHLLLVTSMSDNCIQGRFVIPAGCIIAVRELGDCDG